MSKALTRVARIRGLWEEMSRRQMEMELSRLREIEQRSELAEADVRESRQRSFRSLDGAPSDAGAGNREWLTEEANWSRATGRRRRAELEREVQQPKAEAVQEQFIARHREREQAEILLSSAGALLRGERTRREQRSLDDWFQVRTGVRRASERSGECKEAGDGDPTSAR